MSEDEKVPSESTKKNTSGTDLLFPIPNRIFELYKPVSTLGLLATSEAFKKSLFDLSTVSTPWSLAASEALEKSFSNISTLSQSVVNSFSGISAALTPWSLAISEELQKSLSNVSVLSQSVVNSFSGLSAVSTPWSLATSEELQKSLSGISAALTPWSLATSEELQKSLSGISAALTPWSLATSEELQKSLSNVSILSQSVVNSFSGLSAVSAPWSLATSEELQKSLSGISGITEEALKSLSRPILISNELVFDNWVKTNTQLFDIIKERIHFAQQLDTKILPALEKYNWFISVSLEELFIRRLSQIIDGNSNKLANDLKNAFIVYFSENNYKKLDKMVMGWADNPLFKPRMKLLKDSVNLLKHSHKSYNPANLLIPILISQIDGVLTDYLIENQFKITKINKQWIWQDKNMKNNYSREQVYKKIFDPTIKDYTLTNGGLTTSLEIGSDFILNTLFQTAYTRQNLKKPFGLSRHKIMHGENTTYGRKDHLFRTFLVLDFLYGLENVDCK